MKNKSRVKFQGAKIELIESDVDFLTPEEVRKITVDRVGKGRRIAIACEGGKELRPLDQIDPHENLGQEVVVKTFPSGTIKGATLGETETARRERFIKAQVASVAEVYGERYGQSVQLDSKFRFVFIPCFTLPRKWGMRTTPILIWFPPEYPKSPPNGFYLSHRCSGPHIFSRNVYGASPDLSAYGWNWYCVNCGEGWSPKEDPNQEDNLWKILDVIRLTLSINEF